MVVLMDAKDEGREEGRAEGRDNEIRERIQYMLQNGKNAEEIADFCGYPYDVVKRIENEMIVSES